MTKVSSQTIQYNILFRACDKIESVHKAKRPFGLNKTQTIKVSFYSIYKAFQEFNCNFKIVGDDLSKDLLDFFKKFDKFRRPNTYLSN